MNRQVASERALRSLQRPTDHVIVVFGSTGDLAKRELFPGLFPLLAAGLLPEHFRIVGTAPSKAAPSQGDFKPASIDAVTAPPHWALPEES